MNRRAKTALIMTVAHMIFALLKFACYRLTGSITVLAEAWHSMADIASSILVFSTTIPPPTTKDTASQSESLFKSSEETAESSSDHSHEYVSTLLIGGFLLFLSAGMLVRTFQQPLHLLTFSLSGGLCFLLFALISYGLFRYEGMAGVEERSSGLIADALHARSDMYASLLTGFVLILYQVGINLDRFGSVIVSLLILATAVEILASLPLFQRYLPDKAPLSSQLGLFPKLDTLPGMLRQPLLAFFQVRHHHPRLIRHLGGAVVGLLVISLLLLAAQLFFFTVQPGQSALVERWGKASPDKQYRPGLHVRWPAPIDRVRLFDQQRIRSLWAGVEAPAPDTPLIWTREHGSEHPYLSADNSFLYPRITIEYRIKDIFQYAYSLTAPETMLARLAIHTMTRAFSRQTFYEVATSERALLEKELLESLRKKLNELSCGLDILSVYLMDIHPPVSIAPAFEEVIASMQDRERMINQALAYRNEVLPAARGSAKQQWAEAQNYRTHQIDQAQGAAKANRARHRAFSSQRTILRQHLLYQHLGAALTQQPLMLVDPRAGTADIWYDFDSGFEPREPMDDPSEDSGWNYEQTQSTMPGMMPPEERW